MTQYLERSALVNELTVLNEEADYHAERAAKLEEQLRECVDLLKNWWGGTYKTPFCQAVHKATEAKLIEIAKADLL